MRITLCQFIQAWSCRTTVCNKLYLLLVAFNVPCFVALSSHCLSFFTWSGRHPCMAHLPSSDEDNDSFNEPTPPSGRKRKSKYSENIWPKRVKMDDCNVLYAGHLMIFNSLESVVVDGIRYRYFENLNCEYDLLLSHCSFKMESSSFTMDLPCVPPPDDDTLFMKANFLYQQVQAFPNIENVFNHEIRCRAARPERLAEPGSDGEDINDAEVVPEFDNLDLAVVITFFRRFFNAYKVALEIGLYNAVGKNFLDAAWEYMDLCQTTLNKQSKFAYLHNTSTGEPQPGAMFIKWSIPKRRSRKTSVGDRKTLSFERYADHVVYDKVTALNVSVSEVKENKESAVEAQNNEQMLGLWKGPQKVMLGQELRGTRVRPKILALKMKEMHMFYLKELDITINMELVELLKLMSAFLVCVDYVT